jgi:hypothetical protein
MMRMKSGIDIRTLTDIDKNCIAYCMDNIDIVVWCG